MVSIDTSALTQWESPDRLDGLGLDLVSTTEAYRTTVDGLNGDWKRIDPHYRGAGNDRLVDGLMPAVRKANQLATAGVSTDEALLTLADRLRTLASERSTFESDVATFHAIHGWTALEDLDSTALAEYHRLEGKAGSLQNRYDTAIRTCVGALDRIRPSSLSTASPGAMGSDDYVMMGVDTLVFGAIPGAIADTAVVRTTSQGRRAIGPSTSFHTTLFGRHVRFLDPLMAVTADPRGAWAAWRNPSDYVGRHRGAPSPGAAGATTNAIDTRFQSPSMAGMTLSQRLGRLGRNFGSSFLDGLPVVGEVRGYRPPAGAGTVVDGITVNTNRSSSMLRVGGRSLGTVGTLFTAGLTYREERTVEASRVAAENPDLNRQQVEQRATENAVAGTVGRVGSTVLASAAVGAAAGTVVPGAGNVVGFVAGLATGIAMEVPIADVDGDGQKDSLAKMAGEGLKKGWDWIRGR